MPEDFPTWGRAPDAVDESGASAISDRVTASADAPVTALCQRIAATLWQMKLGQAGMHDNRVRMQRARKADELARARMFGSDGQTPETDDKDAKEGTRKPGEGNQASTAPNEKDSAKPTGKEKSEKHERTIDPTLERIFAEIGYLQQARYQLQDPQSGYRLHIFANLHDPAIATHALDIAVHRAALADANFDPVGMRHGRIMLESFIKQAPALTFDRQGLAEPRHAEFWKIVRLYLQDDRVADFLRADPACVARLRQELHRIFWRDRRPEAIRFHRKNDAVDYVNQKLADTYGGFPVALPTS